MGIATQKIFICILRDENEKYEKDFDNIHYFIYLFIFLFISKFIYLKNVIPDFG